VRWDIGRDDYRVDPGLYALGDPSPESPVLVTSNYKLTFDVVRRDAGIDAWILVLDTRGINVWCAGGKGRFSHDEIARRVASSGLDAVVRHRELIVPVLGANGVAAWKVRALTGYRVVWGPARVADLGRFMAEGRRLTPELRTPPFALADRAQLVPVELTYALRQAVVAVPMLVALSAAWPLTALFTGGGFDGALWLVAALVLVSGWAAGIAIGTVLTPLALPLVPLRRFAGKGALLAALAATPVVALAAVAAATGFATTADGRALAAAALTAGAALAPALVAVAVASWYAMNFTGTSTYTSPSGVEAEMRRWIPIQGVLLALALVIWIGAPIVLAGVR
jgi:hypothetical protein